MTVPSVVLTASVGISGAATVNLTIPGTVLVDDVIYVSVSAFNGGATTTSVSCTGSGNAQIRTPHRWDATIRIAWCTISSFTINPVFTINFASGMNGVVGAMVIRGAYNPQSPFDVSPELPNMRGSVGADFGGAVFGDSIYFTTYNPDSLLIFSAFANSASLLTPPSGFTQQISAGSNSTLLVATKDASSDVSGLFAQCGSGPNQRCIADAIAGQPWTPTPHIPYVVLSASGGGSGISTYSMTFLGTVQPGDIVYVMASVFNGAQTISSVGCDGSSNATIRHVGFNNAINSAWATISATTVNPVFVMNFSGSCSPALAGIVVRGGGSPTVPFDTSGTIPNEIGGNTNTYTTVNTNDLLIYGGFLNNGNNEVTPPAGWKVWNWDYSGPNCVIATLVAPNPVTSLSAVQTASIGLAPFMYGDAIRGYAGIGVDFNGSYSPPSGSGLTIDFNPGGSPPAPAPPAAQTTVNVT